MAVDSVQPDSLRRLFLEQAITVWKHKWLVLAVAWITCAAGWAAVMMVPQSFESNARAFVDVNGLLTPLLKGLIVDTTPAESEGYLRQTLLSRPNLDQVIVLANLGPPLQSAAQHEELVNTLAKDVSVRADENNLVSISYANRSPVVAKNVVDALLTIFAEKAASSSRVEMDKARSFLNEQIGQYASELRAAEQRRAMFRKKYESYFTDTGVIRPETLQAQVTQLRQQYEDGLATRNAIASQMAQVPQLLDVTGPPAVSNNGQVVVASAETRLAQAKRNLADLQLVYTDKHPDVIAAKRTVAELQAEVESDRKGKGTGEGKVQISNPAYEQLRLKLVDADAMLPALKSRLDKATADYDTAKSLSAEVPEIDAKSQDIDRDYNVIKTNYDELVKRREATNLSQAADDRADRTQFRVVDPPQIPIFPSFPNRILLFSLATLLGIGAGLAAPIALERIHPTFGSPARLRGLGIPVIGTVTLAPSVGGTGILLRNGLYATAMASLLVVYAGLMFVATNLHRELW
jgi:polysaccharide chain length determinant protein (PEP-CTERM system associated)